MKSYNSEEEFLKNYNSDEFEKLSMTAEQVGMRAAVMVSGIFPLLGLVTILVLMKYLNKRNKG